MNIPSIAWLLQEVIDNYSFIFYFVGMRFLFIHEGNKSDDSIKNFFNDCYELYVKALLNPFIDKNSKIFSPYFDQKIKYLIKKHF